MMEKIKDLKWVIHPLIPERWSDLESLFGPKGACGGCWCTYWRQTRSQFNSSLGESNRRMLKSIVQSGKPVGLLAYMDDIPVGWMAIAPREEYPTLDRSKVLKRVDKQPVWSITCFYTATRYRGKGVTDALIEASKEYVRKHNGKIIEGYPIIPSKQKVSPVAAYTGIFSAFLKAGFREVARYSASRPIMRFEL